MGMLNPTFSTAEASITQRIFPVWKTIKLGTGIITATDFRRAIPEAGFCITNYGHDLFDKPAFQTSPHEIEIKLVRVRLADLGLFNRASHVQICAKAEELGLRCCSSEVGPQLRLQYKEQPETDKLIIGMKPITVSCGHHAVFTVEERKYLDSNLRNDPHGVGFYGDGKYLWIFQTF